MSVAHNYPFLFNSSQASGAQNISTDGSRFSVQLPTPLNIPAHALTCTIELHSARIWYISKNISAEYKNNLLHVTTAQVSTIGTASPFIITIPDGLYASNDLNKFLSREFVNLGFPSNLVVFGGNTATQKSVLTFLANTQVDFTQADSVNQILGYNARLVPTTLLHEGYSDEAENNAQYNRLESYLIKTDLISTGIPTNNYTDGTLGTVPISTANSPGTLITYEPSNVLTCDASELIGASKSYITFRLTDQLGRAVDTVGEDYGFVIVLRYTMPLPNSRPRFSSHQH